jgi:hypothetical protein
MSNVTRDLPIYVHGMDTDDFFTKLEEHHLQVKAHWVTGTATPCFLLEGTVENLDAYEKWLDTQVL